jgi:hypothetical protein
MSQFQVIISASGNLICYGGYVIDMTAATTTYQVIGGQPLAALYYQQGVRMSLPPNTAFCGGGGGNVYSDGTLTGTFAPIGWFTRIDVNEWEDQYGNILSRDEFGVGFITIDADVIADCSTLGTIAPTGTFSSTTFGEDTYNGGTPFTLTLTDDGAQVISTATVTINAGTAQAGSYELTDWHEWTSVDDPDFVLTTNTDGTAQISDATDVIAERAEFVADDPTGAYLSTAYGELTYNSELPFVADVQIEPASPQEGYIYVELTISSGALTGASEPIFAASLPTNTSTREIVPIAYSDGLGSVIQIHEGPIYFR